MALWRKKQQAKPTVPETREVLTDGGKATALDFGTDAERCFAYLKAAVRSVPHTVHMENAGAACFVTENMNPALWTLLSKAHITGRVWTTDARAGKKRVSLFKPLGAAF
jgi:hypothetical protein